MNSKRLLLATCLTLTVVGILPRRVLPLFGRGEVFAFVPAVADATLDPLKNLLTSTLRAIRGGQVTPSISGTGEASDAEKELIAAAAKWKRLFEELMAENERLRAERAGFLRVIDLNPGFAVTQVMARVVGVPSDPSSGVISVRPGPVAAGSGDVALRDKGAVATIDGVFLVGRVTSWGAVANVLPLTEQGTKIDCVILTDEQFLSSTSNAIVAAPAVIGADGRRLVQRVQLEARSNGTLVGPALYDTSPNVAGKQLRAGMVVRLASDAWPRHAQMMIVGRVIAVDEQGNARERVTVAPLYDLSRLSEVTLQYTTETAVAPASRSVGGAGGGR